MKKAWQRPELVVLVRGKLEENVLINCKVTVRGMSGPNILRPRCISVCTACKTLGAT